MFKQILLNHLKYKNFKNLNPKLRNIQKLKNIKLKNKDKDNIDQNDLNYSDNFWNLNKKK